MATTSETLRAYQGPALFSYGFRPFFLGGAIWAALAMALFTLMLQGRAILPTALTPVDWHAHELLYGFLPAIVAGFLLTAVPNWTGRLPVAGTPLAVLFLVWLTGRIAIAFSLVIGTTTAAVADMSFILALGLIVSREILASKNTKNLKVLLLVALLGAGNLAFHIEVAIQGYADIGKRLGIAAAILLITLIGGRIVPSFTRNWLAKSGLENLPAPFSRFDIGAIASSAAALFLWVAMPNSLMTAAACGLAGVLHLIRVVRWKGYRTFEEPLVTILHAGYIFVPIGFLLMTFAIARSDAMSAVAAVHAWTAGAVGLMTLAVMTRASLGHTGHELTASSATIAIYTAAGASAVARLVAALGAQTSIMLHFSALAWILAFGGFAVVFGPLLLTRNPRAR